MGQSPFLQYVEEQMWRQRYAKRSIKTYLYWIRAFILFHDKRHPSELNDTHVEDFLNHLVIEIKVAKSTQALALNALNYLYKQIIKKPLDTHLSFVKSVTPRKLPVVLTHKEVQMLFQVISPNYYLPAALLYDSGLRLMEMVQLRVHDIDFDYNCIRIWNAKLNKTGTLICTPQNRWGA